MNWVDIGIFSNLFFNSYVLFKDPFEFYFPYIFIILFLPFFFIKYRFPRELLYILVPLAFAGILNVAIDNNTMRNFFKIFANIAVNLIFYRFVMEYYEFDVKRMFRMYLKGCVLVSVIGLIQLVSYWVGFRPGYDLSSWLPLNKWQFNPSALGVRINSFFCEPSNFGLSIAPGFFISLYSLIRKDYSLLPYKSALIIIAAYVCTFSSLAYFGVFLAIVLMALNFGMVRYVFIAIPISIILFNVAYNNVEEFTTRVDGVKALFIDGILEKKETEKEAQTARLLRLKKLISQIHGSSFILYNNYIVAKENFAKNPLLGSGLGSHELAYEKYNINYLLGNIYKSNTADANSMFLRIVSEVGLMGIIFTFLFLFKFNVSKNLLHQEKDEYWLISNALLLLIIIQLIRQGNYTFSGFFMYAWMYYYNCLAYMNYKTVSTDELTENSQENFPASVKV